MTDSSQLTRSPSSSDSIDEVQSCHSKQFFIESGNNIKALICMCIGLVDNERKGWTV